MSPAERPRPRASRRVAEQMKGMPVSGVIETSRIAPLAIVVMGVSGSGKSTLGALLAGRLGCDFLEGDSFHSALLAGLNEHGLLTRDRLAKLDPATWKGLLDRAVAAAAITCSRAGANPPTKRELEAAL